MFCLGNKTNTVQIHKHGQAGVKYLAAYYLSTKKLDL